MALIEAMQAASAAITLAKELLAVQQSMSEAEFKLKIAELTTLLADVKLQLVEMQETLQEKDTEIAKLKDVLQRNAELIEVNGFHYAVRDEKPTGRPFCPICRQNGTLIELVRRHQEGQPSVCPNCNRNFGRVSQYFAN